MINFKHGPKIVSRPVEAPAEFEAEAQKKLYAVKVTLGDIVLAQGVVQLPSVLECEKPKESTS